MDWKIYHRINLDSCPQLICDICGRPSKRESQPGEIVLTPNFYRIEERKGDVISNRIICAVCRVTDREKK